jgi:hypothetical protein
VSEPQPVQVCRFTPAKPNAGGISTAGDFSARAEPLHIQELRIELARSPSRNDFAHLRLIHAEQCGQGAQVGREIDNSADVQVAVSPAVEPATDPGLIKFADRLLVSSSTALPPPGTSYFRGITPGLPNCLLIRCARSRAPTHCANGLRAWVRR